MTVDEETWQVATVARQYGVTVQQIADAINEGREQPVSRQRVLRATTTPPQPSEESTLTLEGLAEQRAERDRTIAVWVEGDPSARVSGRAAAIHVAYLLTDDEAKIIEPQETDGNVAAKAGDALLLTYDPGGFDGREMRRKLDTIRVHEHHVVVHAPELPAGLTKLLDAHVEFDGIDDPLEVTQYQHHPYEGDTYEIPLDGLTEGDDV